MMNNDEKRAFELAERTFNRLVAEIDAAYAEIEELTASMTNALNGEMYPDAAREIQRMAFDLIRLTTDLHFNEEQLENTRSYILEREDDYYGVEEEPEAEPEHDIRFLWNGVKVDGEFEKCWYSPTCGSLDSITIYADRYGRTHLRDLDVTVNNDTDTMTDYFDKDSCRIDKSSRYWDEVWTAYCKQEIHNLKRSIKYYEKRGWDCEDKKAKLEGYQQELAA